MAAAIDLATVAGRHASARGKSRVGRNRSSQWQARVNRRARHAGAVAPGAQSIVAQSNSTAVCGSFGMSNSLRLPAEPAKGTSRLYAARRGQVSYDGAENALKR